jgi:integrase/recombinase XerC
MPDSRTRVLSLAPPPPAVIGERVPVTLAGEPGLADVVTFGRQQQRVLQAPSEDEEERFFADTLAEYQWARDVAGLAPSTLERLARPVIEVCEHYGLVPWRLTPRHVDRYFSGPGKRAGATVRQKLNRIDGYFAFLEQRYGGEIARRFGCAVECPVDPFNRPAHRGGGGMWRRSGAGSATIPSIPRRRCGRRNGCRGTSRR